MSKQTHLAGHRVLSRGSLCLIYHTLKGTQALRLGLPSKARRWASWKKEASGNFKAMMWSFQLVGHSFPVLTLNGHDT